MSIKYQLGLIGYPLSHSFSKKYFSEKFEKEQIDGFDYELFPIETINSLPDLIKNHPKLLGLNVTIPYKQQVLDYLDEIEAAAAKAGAVNTIKIKNNHLIGYNSDIYGFEISLFNLLKPANISLEQHRALILGTGGAAKAVAYVLEKWSINHQFVTRKAKDNCCTYADLSSSLMNDYSLIVNTTPLGMSPNLDSAPDIPYENLGSHHFLYDLVYNPKMTKFLNEGKKRGAHIMNGLEMLYLQAEKSWSIWTEDLPI